MLRILLLLFISATLFSCKQKTTFGPDMGQGVGSCRIARMANYFDADTTGYYATTFAYDDSNRISHIVSQQPTGSLITDITYAQHSIVARHHDALNNERNRDSIVLDDQGRITAQGVIVPGNQFAYWSKLSYDANGDLFRIDYYFSPTAAVVTNTLNFRWENGDMVQSANGYTTSNLEYLPRREQLACVGDVSNLWAIGRPLYYCRHLLKADYTFDAAGKVIRQKLANGYRKYDYECF